MKKRPRISLLLIGVLITSNLLAQTGIKGQLLDAKTSDPLMFANVVITGTNKGAQTDFDGNFIIGINPGLYGISINYIGYQNKEIDSIKVEANQITDLGKVLMKELYDQEITNSLESITNSLESIPNSKTQGVPIKNNGKGFRFLSPKARKFRKTKTFKVCEVEKAVKKLETKPYREILINQLITKRNEREKTKRINKMDSLSSAKKQRLIADVNYYPTDIPNRKLESLAQKEVLLGETSFHPFVNTLHLAYAHHYPMTISPDMIWLLIAQGFANHVNQNGEELRDYFVDFQGKKLININAPTFSKGNENNDWPGIFYRFSEKIEENTGAELLDLITGDFSTTGPIEKAAFQITLMDAMKSYFLYSVTTMCGIPEITLEGTVEDWKLIEEKTKELAQYDLEWWTDELLPVLQKMTDTAAGNPDFDFWNSIYKWNSVGSGSPYITGWILKFFPYTETKGVLSQFVGLNKKDEKSGISYSLTARTDNFTSGISEVDFIWNYYSTFFQMELLAGFVGFQQDPKTLSLRPEISWAVIDKQLLATEEQIKDYDNKGNQEYLESIKESSKK